MKSLTWIACGLLCTATAHPAGIATNKVKFQEIVPLLETMRSSAGAQAAAAVPARPERPNFQRTPEGHLESLSAPPGYEFPAPGGPPLLPEAAARNFLRQHGKSFGITSPSVDFSLRKKHNGRGRHSIRLQQSYDGIPVFGSEVAVQLNDGRGVEFVSGNFDRDTDDLDSKRLSTKPLLTADAATAAARTHYAPAAPGQPLTITPPKLFLFVPALLKLKGPKRLTWQMEVWSADRETVAQKAFFDAHSGEFVQQIALIHEALNRQISDAANTSAIPGDLVRSEGGPPSAVGPANSAYDYLGDIYNFYASRFGRDGIFNDGAPLLATVRWCDPNKPCPLKNANWDGTRMKFGEDYAVDDVTGHELTHGVISAESNLIYLNESGAINESLADIFGEFVDLVNGRGSDGSSDRWYIGEDLPFNLLTLRSTIRRMDHPPTFDHPDWRGSSYYQDPSNTEDSGGVHKNSGINNKLCYLLTDGDEFREIQINGMGIDRVAALYYEANVNLLIASSGWDHLGSSLQQAAVNLGWNESERANLRRGLSAVGIGTPLAQYYVDENASGACFSTGDSYCSFVFDGGPYPKLNEALAERAGPKTLLLRGTAHETRIAGEARIIAWDATARIQQ